MLTHIIGLELGEKITSVELPLQLDDADVTDVWEGDNIEYTFMVGYHELVLINITVLTYIAATYSGCKLMSMKPTSQ